jgi:hypothetical protein
MSKYSHEVFVKCYIFYLKMMVKVLGETFSIKERKSRTQGIRFTNITL